MECQPLKLFFEVRDKTHGWSVRYLNWNGNSQMILVTLRFWRVKFFLSIDKFLSNVITFYLSAESHATPFWGVLRRCNDKKRHEESLFWRRWAKSWNKCVKAAKIDQSSIAFLSKADRLSRLINHKNEFKSLRVVLGGSDCLFRFLVSPSPSPDKTLLWNQRRNCD